MRKYEPIFYSKQYCFQIIQPILGLPNYDCSTHTTWRLGPVRMILLSRQTDDLFNVSYRASTNHWEYADNSCRLIPFLEARLHRYHYDLNRTHALGFTHTGFNLALYTLPSLDHTILTNPDLINLALGYIKQEIPVEFLLDALKEKDLIP